MSNKAILLILASILIGCSNPPKEHEQTFPEPIDYSQLGIETAQLQKMKVEEIIQCRGKVVIKDAYRAYASSPIQGVVKELLKKTGAWVEKGETIAIVQHADIINIQKEYVQMKHEMTYLEEEFKRQGELSFENAASLKKMQKAKSEFWAQKSKFQALEAQIKLMGINPEALENGFVSKLRILAPISGYITERMVLEGQFIKPEQSLMLIENNHKLRYIANLPADRLNEFKLNQSIDIFLPNNESIKGSIVRMDHKIENGTIKAYLSVLNEKQNLIPGMEFQISIKTGNTVESQFIHKEAILIEKGKSYVFVEVAKKYFKIPIDTGIENQQFVQIKNNKIKDRPVVIKGVDYLKTL